MKKFLLLFTFIPVLTFGQIKFDADFESGNLKSVTTNDSLNYTVTTYADIVGRWFYFRMSGVKDKFVKVTFANSDADRPMYSYDNREFTRFTQGESPYINYFQKTFSEDTVYIAYYTPYTLSYLQERINEWRQSEFVKVDTLGFTNHNLPIEEITLTDTTVADSGKYEIWIHARTHPSETPSSFHFDGIVQKLLEDDDVISFYRKKIIFHLIPFTNPDGVYYGKSRVNYDGVDVESNWDEPDYATTKEVKILKARMSEINNKKHFSVFFNLHSQVSSFCTFWIHTAASTTPNFYRKEFQISNLNTSDNPYFTPNDYSFSSLKTVFPEGWLWSNYGSDVMALTYETPYDKYSTDIWVTNENLYQIGFRTVYAVAEYLELSHPKHILLDNKNAIASGTWNTDTTGVQFYSDNFYTSPAGNGENSITYSTEELEPGMYDIYGWWPENPNYAYNTQFTINAGGNENLIEKTQKTNGGQWNFMREVSLNNSGTILINLTNNASGTVAADAFRIIYRGPVTSVEDKVVRPTNFTLYQNYPNPFNPATTIRFELAERSHVQLRVFNALGELVAVLVNKDLGTGQHEVIFDAADYKGLASGIYYYNLTTGNHSVTKGMVLVK